MNPNLRWKLILILVVVGLSIFSFYPPSQKVNLGLDLKGGVHLVLRVQTDDALRLETETTVERLRDTLTRGAIQFAKLEMTDPKTFVVEGIQNDPGYRTAAVDADTVYNRSSRVGGYTYSMKPNIENQLRGDAVTQALQTIERRVNELGVAEPIVARQGNLDQILVELPGVSDVQRAKDLIRSTALLELKIVEQGPFAGEEQARSAYSNAVPPDILLLPGSGDPASGGAPGTVFYAVRRASVVTGRDLRNARPTLDENNLPAVGFSLNSDGARKFGTATEQNIGRQLAIVLDGRVSSAPVIQSRISDEGRISGSFTQQEAQDLSLVLRSGALPASLTYLEERTVGPTLGADSVRAGVAASIGGLAFVVLFMMLLLQAHRPQRDHLDRREPADPARPDGLSRGHDDAARHRRLHPHNRHGRRLERADLRAHQGRNDDGPRRARRRQRRLRPRVVDDRRHPRLVAHFGLCCCCSSAPGRSAASP